MPAYDVAVIGLGAMGSAALMHLARRGARVIGLDRFEPGHTRGSSHGESRAIRLAYFEHPSYVPLVRRAFENWRALEALSGERVLIRSGIVEAGPAGSQLVKGSLASSAAHDIPLERLEAREVNARFPAFALPDGWDCLFQPDAGILLPETIIALEQKAALAAGATTRFGAEVLAVEPGGGGSVRIALADGSRIEAGSAVIAAGAWIGELEPMLKPHLALTRQVMAWFRPSRPETVRPGRMPFFILDTPELVYGFPDFAGSGVKAASHRLGPRLDTADDQRPEADADEIAPVARTLQTHLPGAAGPVTRTASCIYTSTPDGDFVLGPHALHPQIVLASPCSGHGFKFSSAIGEILADLALTGETVHDISRFSPARLGPPG